MAPSHVELMKLMIAYTLVGAFIFTVLVTCLSLIGWVKFSDRRQQAKLFSTLIVELVVIGLGVFTNLLQLSPAQATSTIQQPLRDQLIVERRTNDEIADRMQIAALEGLRPEAVMLATRLVDESQRRGIQVRIRSGYRSLSAQRALYEGWRRGEPGFFPTARYSIHNTGLAFDVTVFRASQPEFQDNDAYQEVGRIGRGLGLIWGGESRERWHFETRDAHMALQVLRAETDS
jgi:D-alanyl-D-alanine dipeptidase